MKCRTIFKDIGIPEIKTKIFKIKLREKLKKEHYIYPEIL